MKSVVIGASSRKCKRVLYSAIAILGLAVATQAGADQVAAGKAAAAACAACHGVTGVSANPMWPNLAGQQKAYLEKQMKDFRAGTRKDAVMENMAKNLSDADIENIAAYYNSLGG